MFKCLNPECGRKILILGRISVEKKPSPNQMFTEVTRTILEAPCCPFCGSKEFEEVKES
jgi:DNA-directed RNA polymerase subunit RPC12/RpoP